jgi:hypothetical protein
MSKLILDCLIPHISAPEHHTRKGNGSRQIANRHREGDYRRARPGKLDPGLDHVFSRDNGASGQAMIEVIGCFFSSSSPPTINDANSICACVSWVP